MKIKLIIVVSALIGILFFSGCGQSQPSFHPNNKNIVFVENKPYLIPLQTRYNRESIRNKSDIKEKQRYGLSCRKGDIVWGSYDFFNALAKNRAAKNSLLHEAARENHIGCSSPLSNQQYQYVLQQQQINANRAAVNAQINAQRNAANSYQQSNYGRDYMNNRSSFVDSVLNPTPTAPTKALIGTMPGGKSNWIKFY